MSLKRWVGGVFEICVEVESQKTTLLIWLKKIICLNGKSLPRIWVGIWSFWGIFHDKILFGILVFCNMQNINVFYIKVLNWILFAIEIVVMVTKFHFKSFDLCSFTKFRFFAHLCMYVFMKYFVFVNIISWN